MLFRSMWELPENLLSQRDDDAILSWMLRRVVEPAEYMRRLAAIALLRDRGDRDSLGILNTAAAAASAGGAGAATHTAHPSCRPPTFTPAPRRRRIPTPSPRAGLEITVGGPRPPPRGGARRGRARRGAARRQRGAALSVG